MDHFLEAKVKSSLCRPELGRSARCDEVFKLFRYEPISLQALQMPIR